MITKRGHKSSKGDRGAGGAKQERVALSDPALWHSERRGSRPVSEVPCPEPDVMTLASYRKWAEGLEAPCN